MNYKAIENLIYSNVRDSAVNVNETTIELTLKLLELFGYKNLGECKKYVWNRSMLESGYKLITKDENLEAEIFVCGERSLNDNIALEHGPSAAICKPRYNRAGLPDDDTYSCIGYVNYISTLYSPYSVLSMVDKSYTIEVDTSILMWKAHSLGFSKPVKKKVKEFGKTVEYTKMTKKFPGGVELMLEIDNDDTIFLLGPTYKVGNYRGDIRRSIMPSRVGLEVLENVTNYIGRMTRIDGALK